MTSKRLELIRARHLDEKPFEHKFEGHEATLHKHRGELLAEVDALRAALARRPL